MAAAPRVRPLPALRSAGKSSSQASMGRFVALLRGVGPTNPAMRNDKLAGALASAGCRDVTPILASGNLVFSSDARRTQSLEKKISQALATRLGLTCDVIVRSQADIEAMVAADPFHGATHGKTWYLTATFCQDGSPTVHSKLARATMNGPDFMAELEQRHGRHITTRSWNTVLRILGRLRDNGRRRK